MRVKVLFDKETCDKKLHTGWGVSFLVNDEIIFDTGEKGEWLLENIDKLKVDIDELKSVVISHQHWDHTNGLWALLEKKKNIKVYICPDFSQEFKDKINNLGGKIVECKDFVKVDDNIFSTGQIEGFYEGGYLLEQALVLKIKDNLVVMTGCSHPGIVKILKIIKNKFIKEKVYFVFGGFHLMDKDNREIKIIVEMFKEIGVEKVGPTHCTGYDAQSVFKEAYKDNFIFVKVGEEFRFSA